MMVHMVQSLILVQYGYWYNMDDLPVLSIHFYILYIYSIYHKHRYSRGKVALKKYMTFSILSAV